MDHNAVTDIAMCVSLCPSVTVKEHLSCSEQCMHLHILCHDKYQYNFRRQNILDIFWTTFLFSTGFRITHNSRHVRSHLTPLVQNLRYRPARWASLSQTQLSPIPPGRPLPSILTTTALQGHPSGILQGQQPAWRRHVSPE